MPSLDFYQYLIWNISVFFFRTSSLLQKASESPANRWHLKKQLVVAVLIIVMIMDDLTFQWHGEQNCFQKRRQYLYILYTVKLVFRVPGISGKLFKIILHFLRIFLAYLMFFQSFAVPSACSILQNHQICFLAFNPFGFRVPNPSLNIRMVQIPKTATFVTDFVHSVFRNCTWQMNCLAQRQKGGLYWPYGYCFASQ